MRLPRRLRRRGRGAVRRVGRRPRSPRPARGPGAVAARPDQRSPSGLTTRAVILGVVICAIAISLAYPVRQYLGQRAEIAHLEEAQAAQRQRVAQLEAKAAQLDDPAYIRAQARTRLHYVDPGETAYVVVAGSPPPAHRPATDARAAPADSAKPWYSQLWASTAAAGSGTR